MKRIKTLPALLAAALLGIAQIGHVEAQAVDNQVALGTSGVVLTVLEPQIFESLAIYPLTANEVKDNSKYTHLDKAVSSNTVKITEWGSGTVPNLKVANKGKGKVFIMTGEIMTGAKQDRMSAHDVLLPPKSSTVKLPVYCVEQGRWVKQSNAFAAGRTAGTKKLRKSAVAKSSQGKIWSDVAEKSRESGVHSSTGTMQAVYNNAQLKQKVAAYERAFTDLPNKTPRMVGFVVAVKGRLDSADVFANPPLLTGLWKKLIKAAATDAVTDTQSAKRLPSTAQVRTFLGLGIDGKFNAIKNPGLGKEFLIEAEGGISGSTLIHNSSVVHMALFPPDKSAGPRELRNGIQYESPQTSSDSEDELDNSAPLPWLGKTKGKKKGKNNSDYSQPTQIGNQKKKKMPKQKTIKGKGSSIPQPQPQALPYKKK